MSNLPRLFRILSITAKFRLYEFAEGQSVYLLLRLILLPFSLISLFSRSTQSNRNVRLRLALEALGPIYIKFGQLLSTRRDFLPPALADELAALQDKVPPFSEPKIASLISDRLGLPITEVFSTLDDQPLASASIAQVHCARLLSGEEVVVKIVRPGIEETVRADIRLLAQLASLLARTSSLGRRLHPQEVINDYKVVILNELNLLAEAANTSQLRRNFENSANLYVPKVYWDFCRPDLIVLERIHGMPISQIEALLEHQVDLKKLAERGVEIFFQQVFDHNFFHADMHPGNIFVAFDEPDSPQYIAIDCAIMGSLSGDDQEYMAKNLLAIFQRDYRRVAELHISCGWIPPETPVHEFESAIRTVCEPIFEKPLGEISFGQILVQLFNTASRFDMEVQPSLVLLQKTLLNIEGLGRQLYPELDLWQTALPYLERWRAKRLSPIALLTRLSEQFPEWIDQLPQLPALILRAINQTGELSALSNTLESLRQQQEKELAEKHARDRLVGFLALGLSALTLLLPAGASISSVPITTLGLAGIGLYLLFFR
ncbi:MAG: ubiquinone biosynthesis regulatory protein kinase UbiB [Gammaproteobacteria bacterium]|nr:ubiquinone biosynthesis regulatory protein kinase UbiB [Gammaproteobacteria bacterium]